MGSSHTRDELLTHQSSSPSCGLRGNVHRRIFLCFICACPRASITPPTQYICQKSDKAHSESCNCLLPGLKPLLNGSSKHFILTVLHSTQFPDACVLPSLSPARSGTVLFGPGQKPQHPWGPGRSCQQWQPASPKGLQSRRITPSPFAEVKGNGSFPGAGACVLPPGSGAGKGGIPGLPLGLRAAPTAPLLQKGTRGQSWHKAGCKGDFGVQM